MRYVEFWKDLQLVAGLEKLAGHDDASTAQQAQVALAGTCNALFTRVKRATESAAPVASTLLAMQDAHRATGEKVAASPETQAEFLEKLATAVYVDDVLSEQLTKLSGEASDRVREVQLLGREYAVQLMRGLLT